MIVAIIIGGIVWIVCGVLAYGMTLAYDQRHWGVTSIEEYRADHRCSLLWALFGPCALLASLINGDFVYGPMYRNPHKEKQR